MNSDIMLSLYQILFCSRSAAAFSRIGSQCTRILSVHVQACMSERTDNFGMALHCRFNSYRLCSKVTSKITFQDHANQYGSYSSATSWSHHEEQFRLVSSLTEGPTIWSSHIGSFTGFLCASPAVKIWLIVSAVLYWNKSNKVSFKAACGVCIVRLKSTNLCHLGLVIVGIMNVVNLPN